jgi:hypothetical protein
LIKTLSYQREEEEKRTNARVYVLETIISHTADSPTGGKRAINPGL